MDKRVAKEGAYVLHVRPYRETSLLVDALTQSHGLISLVAKSARGPKSRFRGQLMPLTPLQISWTGLSDLKSLTAAEVIGLPHQLQGEALWASFYAHELMQRLLVRGELFTDVFGAYQRLLNALKVGSNYSELRYFELGLLVELGYGPTLHETADHQSPVLANSWYRYVLDHGLVLCHDVAPDALTFWGGDLLALQERRLSTESELLGAKRLLRYVLLYRLGSRPLKTPQVWQSIRGA